MKIYVIILLIFTIIFVSGFVFPGSRINVFVNCYNDEGNDDPGCSLISSYCLDEDDNYATKKTFTIAELDETNSPGLWNGTYIPATTGIHTCVAKLRNANLTSQTDNLIISVQNNLASQTNITKIQTDLNGLRVGMDANRTSTATAITAVNATLTQNVIPYMGNSTIGAIYNRVMGIGLNTLIYDLLHELTGGFR